MALPLFAITLFVSAFILFLVQPIIGKMILPKLGGTPQVWNTCMVFFQFVLLAGYAYTHFSSTKFKLRTQICVHALLLFAPLALLLLFPGRPFNVDLFVPPYGSNPITWTLGALTILVGLPFFVVATSAPLLQKWFANTGHPAAKDPYFLYAASNLGSLLALGFYPGVLEWILTLQQQAWTWTFLYAGLIVLVLACAGLVWQLAPRVKLEETPATPPESTLPPASPPPEPPKPAPAPSASKTAIKKGAPKPKGGPQLRLETPAYTPSGELTTWRRLRWVGLAAVPSSLMLGITTHITTDLSPIPLFWLVPLALYLLSFILVFSRWPVVWTGQPHTAMLFAQPLAVCAMVLFEIVPTNHWVPIFFNVVGFFLTAMVCHGELAKDRPEPKYLTEFYLWMSVGGMVGGTFNAMIAPLVFKGGLLELPIAIVAACMLRPRMRESGWTDDFVGNMSSGGPAKSKEDDIANEGPNLPVVLDFALPGILLIFLFLMVFVFSGILESMTAGKEDGQAMYAFLTYLLPVVIAFLMLMRPVRFGLAIGAILLVHGISQSNRDPAIFTDRSYFGILRVKQSGAQQQMPDGKRKVYPYNTLVHGHINHGMNFYKPEDEKKWGDPDEDFSRLSTTYYHRKGPAGIVMEKFNWFPDKTSDNTFWADSRMPASLIGMGALSGVYGQLVDLWSEPPYATIGLGTGTMASYGRPFQHVHFYEIDDHVRKLSLPSSGKSYFNYLSESKKRGCEVQVLMGDARLRMAAKYGPYDEELEKRGKGTGGGPDNFYHMMVVDAFSSDAIPVHLLTKEAFQMYFKKLVPEGVLCVHTSNRYVDLPLVVADVATDLDLVFLRGHDPAPGHDNNPGATMSDKGHFTSEWVMVARKPPADMMIPDTTDPTGQKMVKAPANYYLRHLQAPEGFAELMRRFRRPPEQYWTIPSITGRHKWTDDHSNLMGVLR